MGLVRRWNLVADLGLVLVCALVAGLLGQDANWDQLQYHYWYPWQLFHGGFTDPDLYGGRFQNPLPQVPFYLVASTLTPQVAQALLGALAGTAAVVARRIALHLLPYAGGPQVAASVAAAALAVVGAGFRTELGTSYSDVLLTVLLLGSLLLVIGARPWPALWAGVLAGAAVGLKYTTAPFAIAVLVALWVLPGRRLARTGLWVGGTLVGWLLTGGAWAWNLWRTYDSPTFPFWNTIFASPWYPSADLTDERYGVDGIGQWLAWPWAMATGSARVLDLPVRDPRWLLLAAAVALIAAGWRRFPHPGRAVLAFTLVGLALWLAVFGVIRYAIPVEMTTAVLVVSALGLWLSPRATIALSLVLAVGAGLLTESARSRRVEFSQRWYEVDAEAFAAVRPGDTVLVDGQYPSTFMLPDALPPAVPVHVVQKDFTGTPLVSWLEQDLAAARQVWVVTGRPPSQVDPALGTIEYNECTRIRSNVVDRWLCPVKL